MFASSLTKTAFNWYVNLAPGSIPDWNSMVFQFQNHFSQNDPGVTVSDLTRIQQKLGEPVEDYLKRFKNSRTKCHLNIPEIDFVSIAQDGLAIQFKKRFHGSRFRDFMELNDAVGKYEQILAEESCNGPRFRCFKQVLIPIKPARLAELAEE